MRYYEFVAERDMSAMSDKLQAMIDHPETPEHERENAQRMLDKITGSSEKPIIARKIGADDLQDFGTYTAKGTRTKHPSRGHHQDFTA